MSANFLKIYKTFNWLVSDQGIIHYWIVLEIIGGFRGKLIWFRYTSMEQEISPKTSNNLYEIYRKTSIKYSFNPLYL